MYVYLVRLSENSYYKIGTTKNITKRINELQTGNAEEIFLVNSYKSQYAFKIENALHNFFYDKKKINEWFDFSIEDESRFIELCEKIEKNLIFLKENKI